MITVTGITLLTAEEFNKYHDRIPYVRECWWLRSPGKFNDDVKYVDRFGFINNKGCCVNLEKFGVRPVLEISIAEPSKFRISDQFEKNGQLWTIISSKLAICNQCIGNYWFRKERLTNDFNVYEVSDVKNYIEDWENLMKELIEKSKILNAEEFANKLCEFMEKYDMKEVKKSWLFIDKKFKLVMS